MFEVGLNGAIFSHSYPVISVATEYINDNCDTGPYYKIQPYL